MYMYILVWTCAFQCTVSEAEHVEQGIVDMESLADESL